jgi:hypothetical protein
MTDEAREKRDSSIREEERDNKWVLMKGPQVREAFQLTMFVGWTNWSR